MKNISQEPLSNISVHDIRNWLSNNNSIQNIVDAYVIVREKYICVEDDVYDYEIGTVEYNSARLKSDEWFSLTNKG